MNVCEAVQFICLIVGLALGYVLGQCHGREFERRSRWIRRL